MKKKMMRQFEYDGLGFPVLLLNIPVREIRGVEVPDINYNLLQTNVLLALCQNTLPLTGNEIRFIRQYFEMTYREFANHFGVTHASVIHWEKSKNSFAKVAPTTELCIRLYVLDTLKADNKLFRNTFRDFNYLKFHQEIKARHHKTVGELITIDSAALRL